MEAWDWSEENNVDCVSLIASGSRESDETEREGEGCHVAVRAHWRTAVNADIGELVLIAAVLMAEEFSDEWIRALTKLSREDVLQLVAVGMRVWTLDGERATPCFRVLLNPWNPIAPDYGCVCYPIGLDRLMDYNGCAAR